MDPEMMAIKSPEEGVMPFHVIGKNGLDARVRISTSKNHYCNFCRQKLVKQVFGIQQQILAVCFWSWGDQNILD